MKQTEKKTKIMKTEIIVRDLRKKEQFIVDDAYLNGYARLCGIWATGVYVALCRHTDRNQEAYPSARLISEKLNISERQVFRALEKLESYQIIHRELTPLRKGGFRNTYLLLDRSQWRDKPAMTTSHSVTDRQGHHAYQSRRAMTGRRKKDTQNTKDTQISLRERLLVRLKILFPEVKIPTHLSARKIDYFLWKIKLGEVDHLRVMNPISYITSLRPEEEFPTLGEREEAAKKKETEKAEKKLREKKEKEEQMKINEVEKEEIRKFVSELYRR